ncbi:MAG: glycosyltransferase family 39 protein [Rhizobiaceae bacterium]|nr:glycosyltransferase family 39 protein [Rhizobiaceae bacterium]
MNITEKNGNSGPLAEKSGPVSLIGLIGVLALILAIRLTSLYHNNSELFFDEAQYWAWAQNLEFGYFSKPPVLAWIIRASTEICGSDIAFCVRLSAPIVHFVTAIFIFLTARELFDTKTGFWAGLIFALIPAVSLSATIISTDVPLLMFWSIALYAFIKFERTKAKIWILVLGLSFGLGLMSKYAMIYLPICAVLYSLLVSERPHMLKRPGFWLAMAIGFVILMPNIWWNSQHSFATFSHTGDNIGWRGLNLHPLKALEFLLSQFGVFGPILMGVYLATLFRVKLFGGEKSHQFLVAFSLPILLIIVFQALMSKAYANWAALTYVGASILVADLLVNKMPPLWAKLSHSIHVVIFIALSLAVTRAGPGQLILPGGAQPFKRTQGSAEMADLVRARLAQGNYRAVITTGRKVSALMYYQLRDDSVKVLAWRHGNHANDHFELMHSFQQTPMVPALIVYSASQADGIEKQFSSFEPLGQSSVLAGNISTLHFARVSGYLNKKALN